MRSFLVLSALLVALAVPATALGATARPERPSGASAPRLLALRGHFGGFRRPSLFRRSPVGGGRRFLGGRRGRSHGFLRGLARALAFAAILHLLFSHGFLSILIWLIVIAVVASLVTHLRRRRRRYAY
jgi:hypothetical protein